MNAFTYPWARLLYGFVLFVEWLTPVLERARVWSLNRICNVIYE